MAVQFKPGNNVIYPVYGVAKIQSVEKREIAGKKTTFYILKTLKNDITVMVPVKNTSSVGMRKVVSKNRVRKVFELLAQKTKSSPAGKKQAWNKRHKEYSEKIKNGDIFEVAEVFRDILRISRKKDLSFGEKQIMENAFSLISSEIAVSTSKSEETVEKDIEKAVLGG
ncbi:MAG: CarD family transcriptional regulator [Thermodesulfobacteriota bacterium]